MMATTATTRTIRSHTDLWEGDLRKLIGALIAAAVLASCGQTTATTEEPAAATEQMAPAEAPAEAPADGAATTTDPATEPGYTPPQD